MCCVCCTPTIIYSIVTAHCNHPAGRGKITDWQHQTGTQAALKPHDLVDQLNGTNLVLVNLVLCRQFISNGKDCLEYCCALIKSQLEISFKSAHNLYMIYVNIQTMCLPTLSDNKADVSLLGNVHFVYVCRLKLSLVWKWDMLSSKGFTLRLGLI